MQPAGRPRRPRPARRAGPQQGGRGVPRAGPLGHLRHRRHLRAGQRGVRVPHAWPTSRPSGAPRPFDTLLDIVLADDLRTVLWPNTDDGDEATWEMRAEIWSDPRAMVGGSDAGAHLDRMCGSNYPTAFLGDCLRGRKLVPVEKAVHMMTDQPAQLFGLRDRGLVREGYVADLFVFDPETVGSEPARLVHDLPGGTPRLYAGSHGVVRVLVNGVETVRDGAPTGALPGTLLRSGPRHRLGDPGSRPEPRAPASPSSLPPVTPDPTNRCSPSTNPPRGRPSGSSRPRRTSRPSRPPSDTRWIKRGGHRRGRRRPRGGPPAGLRRPDLLHPVRIHGADVADRRPHPRQQAELPPPRGRPGRHRRLLPAADRELRRARGERPGEARASGSPAMSSRSRTATSTSTASGSTRAGCPPPSRASPSPGPAGNSSNLARPYQVPADNYFVMGDNRTDSCDSRYWGPINQSLIVGKVELRVWPLSSLHIF